MIPVQSQIPQSSDTSAVEVIDVMRSFEQILMNTSWVTHVELLTAIVEMRAAESSEGRPKSWPIAHIGSREWQIRVRKAYSRLSEAITNSQRIVAKYEGVNG